MKVTDNNNIAIITTIEAETTGYLFQDFFATKVLGAFIKVNLGVRHGVEAGPIGKIIDSLLAVGRTSITGGACGSVTERYGM